MSAAPLPANESERLRNLYHYSILDSLPEKAFDSIVEFAANFFQVPIATIGFVDKNRQWFKAIRGLDLCGTEREIAFSAHTILNNEPMVIPDAKQDLRFNLNPMVTGEPFIRFYAGVPLVTTEDYNIGTLCLIDHQPREMNQSQLDRLQHLAELVTVRLGLRLASLKLSEATAKMQPKVLVKSSLFQAETGMATLLATAGRRR